MTISTVKAKKLVEKGGKIFDVRSPVDFARHSIPGSINLPLRNVSHLVKYVKKEEPVIFVCDGETTTDSTMAQNYATQMGYQRVFSLDGIENWDKPPSYKK